MSERSLRWLNTTVCVTALMPLLKTALCLAVENAEGVIKKRECPLWRVCSFSSLLLPFLTPFWKSLQTSAQGAHLFLPAPCLSEMTSIQLSNISSCGDSTSPLASQPGSGESMEQRALVACSLCKGLGDPPPVTASWEENTYRTVWFHQRNAARKDRQGVG